MTAHERDQTGGPRPHDLGLDDQALDDQGTRDPGLDDHGRHDLASTDREPVKTALPTMEDLAAVSSGLDEVDAVLARLDRSPSE